MKMVPLKVSPRAYYSEFTVYETNNYQGFITTMTMKGPGFLAWMSPSNNLVLTIRRDSDTIEEGSMIPYSIFPSRVSSRGYGIGPVCVSVSALTAERFEVRT